MPERLTVLLMWILTMSNPLLDWKTADRLRNPAKMYEYSLQVAAYVAAANYVYKPQGLDITRALIVVALPNEAPQIEELNAKTAQTIHATFYCQGETLHPSVYDAAHSYSSLFSYRITRSPKGPIVCQRMYSIKV